MCCLKFSKRLVPFAITFVVGLFAASIFYCFTSPGKVDYNSVESNYRYKTTHCFGEKKHRKHRKNLSNEEIIYLVPAPNEANAEPSAK